jgi:type I restriction enzyme S subunit
MGRDIGTKKMYQVRSGDFILSGIDARNGAFGIVPSELDGAVVTNDFWYFDVTEETISTDLFLALTQTSWFDHICRLGSDGTTQRIRLQKDKFFNQTITLPLVEDQPGILKRLQSFKNSGSELAAEIGKQKTLLAKYRQAILQDAVEGKLTEDWRQKKTDVEPASELLKRIVAEKEELVKQEKIRKQKPLPEIKPGEIPFEIPGTWQWCRLGDVCYGFQYGTSRKSKKTGKVPVLRMGNIQNGFIDWDDLVYSNSDDEIDKFNLVPDDLLFNRTNSRELVGKTGLYRGERQSIYAGYLVRFHMAGKILAEYANAVLNSTLHSEWCAKVKTDAIGQSNINATKLSLFAFPLPPITEQQAIVRRIETKFALCDALEVQIKASAQTAETLSAAILQELFDQNGGAQ